MRIDIMTLFPDALRNMLDSSIIGRALDRGYAAVECHDIRDYTLNRQKQVDDYPYGGGEGVVMQADPLYNCWKAVSDMGVGRPHTIYMTPQGRPFKQEDAKRLAKYGRLILVCGHYEGIDERFIEECVDEEISIGDFVLTGGELPALTVCDAVCRLLPGVLASEESYTGESHWDGLLEYPQYSRPEEWHGRRVPEVLLSGDHKQIARWRRGEQLRRTRAKRPDMFRLHEPTRLDLELLDELDKGDKE